MLQLNYHSFGEFPILKYPNWWGQSSDGCAGYDNKNQVLIKLFGYFQSKSDKIPEAATDHHN